MLFVQRRIQEAFTPWLGAYLGCLFLEQIPSACWVQTPTEFAFAQRPLSSLG